MKRAALLFLFPVIAFADLNQTVTLSTAGQSNLNLDTGATSTSGGDIQFSGSGITPQGKAKAYNLGTLGSLTPFNKAYFGDDGGHSHSEARGRRCICRFHERREHCGCAGHCE